MIYNKKQLVIIFEQFFNKNLVGNNTFNDLKIETWKWISPLRLVNLSNKNYKKYRRDKFNWEKVEKIDIEPFITEYENKNIILTEVWKKYV